MQQSLVCVYYAMKLEQWFQREIWSEAGDVFFFIISGVGLSDDERKKYLELVLSLTLDDINQLPPDQRESMLILVCAPCGLNLFFTWMNGTLQHGWVLRHIYIYI